MSTELTVPGSSSILNNRMLCEHSIVMNKKSGLPISFSPF